MIRVPSTKRRVIVLLTSLLQLLADDCLGLRPCFAGLQTLVPCVVNLGVDGTSAISEPRTSTTATTDFTRSLRDAALGAYGTDTRRRYCNMQTSIMLINKHTQPN